MARTVVKLEGFRELDAALAELPKATGKNVVRRVLKKRAQPVADSYSAKVRVDKGTLKRLSGVSTRLSRRQRSKHRKAEGKHAVEMFIGPAPLPQAITEEFGTVDQAPQGALRAAWDENKGPLLDGLKADLWAEIEKAAKRLAAKTAKAKG